MNQSKLTKYFRSPILTRFRSKMSNKEKTLKEVSEEISTKQGDEMDPPQSEIEKLRAVIDEREQHIARVRSEFEEVNTENDRLRRNLQQEIESRENSGSNKQQKDVHVPSKEDDQFNKIFDALQLCATSLDKASHKGPMFNPPSFEGRADESFAQFLVELDQYASYMQWDEGTKARSLPMLLRGRAKLFFQNIHENDKKEYQKLLKLLQDKFANSENLLTVFSQLDRKQNKGESVREYATDMIKRIQLANIENESQKCYIFIKGLLPNIATEVYKSQPKDLLSAEKAAIIAEEALKLKPEDDLQSMHTAIQSISSKIEEYNSLTNQAISDINNIKQVRFESNSNTERERGRNRFQYGRLQNHRDITPKRQYQQPPNNYRRFRSPNPRFDKQRYNDNYIFCQRCNVKHRWNQHIVCQRCNNFGHNAQNCRTRSKYLNE